MQTYNFTLTARFEGSASSSNTTVGLTAVGSELVAMVTGPSGDVPQSKGKVTFKAGSSYDPDDVLNVMAPLGYAWSCQVSADNVSIGM